MIGPFLTSLGCPKVSGKNRYKRSKKGDFLKMKENTPRYSSPIYKYAKFQHD